MAGYFRLHKMQAGKVIMPENSRQLYIAHFAPGTAFWWTQPNTSCLTFNWCRHHLINFAEI